MAVSGLANQSGLIYINFVESTLELKLFFIIKVLDITEIIMK